MLKYSIKELEKALNFLRKECAQEFAQIEINEQGKLTMNAVDIGGSAVTIDIFTDDVGRFAQITRTERL